MGLSACVSLPDRQSLVPDTPWSRALIAACHAQMDAGPAIGAAATPQQREFVRRVSLIETALSGKPLVGGNHVVLLRDGPATHKAQRAAIAGARHHVHLITYILTDDQVAQDYLKALTDRRRAGVIVRLMFDSVGGRTVGEPYRKALAEAGVEVYEFGPLNPLKEERWRTTRRGHRKVLVVDGRIAFTGGINISDEYRASSAGRSGRPSGWRDTHIQVRGPAVEQFQKLFFYTWEKAHGRIPPSPQYWPKQEEAGPDFVRMIRQDGTDLPELLAESVAEGIGAEQEPARAIYGSYLAAMSAAQSRIWITQAYFIPNPEFMDVLRRAAERGVDLRILVPSTSDIKLMVHASRYHYAPLLNAGARIFEYEGPVLHAKTAVVDGVWATVGSSNLDYRSFIHNDEANAIIMGHQFGKEMERMFVDDLEQAREITREAWARRSWTERVRQRLAALLKYWI